MRTTISWLADGPFDAVGKISIFMCSAAPLDAFIRSRLQFTAGPVFCFLSHDAWTFRIVCLLFFHLLVKHWPQRCNCQTWTPRRRCYGDVHLTLPNVALVTSSSHPKWPLLYFIFFSRQPQYSRWHFYIPTRLTALLSINQPLRRIKERLTAFGGQQTHMWPWLQSINAAI